MGIQGRAAAFPSLSIVGRGHRVTFRREGGGVDSEAVEVSLPPSAFEAASETLAHK